MGKAVLFSSGGSRILEREFPIGDVFEFFGLWNGISCILTACVMWGIVGLNKIFYGVVLYSLHVLLFLNFVLIFVVATKTSRDEADDSEFHVDMNDRKERDARIGIGMDRSVYKFCKC